MIRNRRNFLKVASAAWALEGLPRLHAEPSVPTPPELASLLAQDGFDADSANSSLIGIVADVHIYLDRSSNRFTDALDDGLVGELNALNPRISDLIFAGDLITSHSLAVGVPRYPSHYEVSRREFRVIKEQLKRFGPDIAIHAVPGNHDTDNQETEPDLWIEELGIPYYGKIVRGGVPILMLNSGHAGGLRGGAQNAWLKEEAADIDPDQEVVIICHHPAFYYYSAESGVKVAIARAFAGHRAPVWMVGGHGHSFGETLFLDRGTRFVQMEVTSGNPKTNVDGNAPGYILLGCQDGRVVSRVFRSLTQPSYQIRSKIDKLKPTRTIWPFEAIPYPCELFNEGFYNRSGRLISFQGSDLQFHFVFLEQIVFKIEPSRFSGKLTEFLLLGTIGPAALPTATCSFSTSQSGPWETVPIPTPKDQVFRFPIPENLRESGSVFVKLATSRPSLHSDLNMVGWGTATDGALLTGYEKWIAARYRTILNTAETAPSAIAAGATHPNILRFAFNLPDSPPPVGTGSSPYSGLPSYTTTFRSVCDYRYPARKASGDPGVGYIPEESDDGQEWRPVAPEHISIRSIDADWEEVRVLKVLPGNGRLLLRVRVEPDTPGDTDPSGESPSALIRQAFGTTSEDPHRQYDPSQAVPVGGMPVTMSGNFRLVRIVHPQWKAQTNPGVSYRIERSPNLTDWEPVPEYLTSSRILAAEGDWEQAETLILDESPAPLLYRVRAELTNPLST